MIHIVSTAIVYIFDGDVNPTAKQLGHRGATPLEVGGALRLRMEGGSIGHPSTGSGQVEHREIISNCELRIANLKARSQETEFRS